MSNKVFNAILVRALCLVNILMEKPKNFFTAILLRLEQFALYRRVYASLMRKKRYRCKALQGLSSYNICINSDMTISCNCQDYDGSGHIGDLNNNTFEEIFSGPVALRFRRSLAAGRLPIKLCKYCVELEKVGRQEAERSLLEFRLPTLGIMVENTAACNLRCLGCQRERLMQTRKKRKMSLEDISIVAETIHDNHIKQVCYFNLGEPFLSKTILEEVSILKNRNPDLVVITSTHGMFIDNDSKIRAALLMDHIFFSIDGANQRTVTKYQVGADFDKSYKNMMNLVQRRNQMGAITPVIEWKYVVFSWNDSVSEVETAVAMAKEAEVDIISFWKGGGPESDISQKFLSDPYFQQLGEKTWKGREICFNSPQRRQLS